MTDATEDARTKRKSAHTKTLPGGVEIPVLGLGLYKAPPGEKARYAVTWALEAGFRHIDTASSYHNEADVARAIADSRLSRKDVFIATKLWKDDMGHDSALRACEKSLEELQTDYIDLYLIHWPVPGKRDESWRALEELHADGRVRAIGVCNYTIDHLRHLLSWADVSPAVNQVEFSPFLFQHELLSYCRDHGVQLEAYSPLTRKRRLREDRVKEIAAAADRTPAQVLLRWAIQHDLVVLVKSLKQDHLQEDAAVFDFELSTAAMRELDALDEGFRVAWDPTGVE